MVINGETDSPVFYGRDNRYQSAPKDIVRSLNAVAEIKGRDRQVMAEKTTENAIRLFGLKIKDCRLIRRVVKRTGVGLLTS